MSNEQCIADLIEDFSELDDDVRDAAKAELIAIGEPAIPQLIEALADNLWDIAESSRRCLSSNR